MARRPAAAAAAPSAARRARPAPAGPAARPAPAASLRPAAALELAASPASARPQQEAAARPQQEAADAAGVGAGGTGGGGAIGGGPGTSGAGGAGLALPRFFLIHPVDSSGAPQTDQPYSVLLGGASDDGAVLAGTWTTTTDPGTNFYWTEASGVVRLDPPSGSSRMPGYWPNVSSDGSTLFGGYQGGFYRWTKQAGYEFFDATVPTLTGPGASGDVAFSRDGSVLWGVASDNSTGWLAYRWRPSDGVVTVPAIPGWPADGGYAGYLEPSNCGGCGITRARSAFSDDGKVVAGYHLPSLTLASPPTLGFIWSEPGTLYELGTMPGTDGCAVLALSRDGTVAFGTCSDSLAVTPPPPKAFRWTAASGMVPIGDGIYFTDTTRDGGVAMGSNGTDALFRWTAGAGAVQLRPPPNTIDLSRYGLWMTQGSLGDDGGSVYGRAPRTDFQPGPDEERPEDAFRWSATDGFVLLPALPQRDYSTINAAAPDGSVLVGVSRSHTGGTTYFDSVGVLWDCGGIRDIAAELTAAAIDLQGTWLYDPVRVWSGTSIMIVGYGIANGNTSAWIAWLPRRC